MSKWHTTSFCENCAKEWCCTNECKYHLLHRIKEAREEVDDLDRHFDNDPYTDNKDSMFKCNEVLAILDKLIAEAEV